MLLQALLSPQQDLRSLPSLPKAPPIKQFLSELYTYCAFVLLCAADVSLKNICFVVLPLFDLYMQNHTVIYSSVTFSSLNLENHAH